MLEVVAARLAVQLVRDERLEDGLRRTRLQLQWGGRRLLVHTLRLSTVAGERRLLVATLRPLHCLLIKYKNLMFMTEYDDIIVFSNKQLLFQ